MAKGIFITPEKCTGCRLCELTCTFNKFDDFNPEDASIRILYLDEQGLQVPMTCIQCDEPDCVDACPVEALTKDEETGVVKLNQDLCIECEACVEACPYGSITYSTRHNRIIKCDQCDGEPQCVKICPGGALEFKEPDGELKDKREKVASQYSTTFKKVYREVAK